MPVRKKKKISNSKYKQRHRILKKLGFIETDGRTKLTAQKKRNISNAWSRHSEVTQGKTDFAVRTPRTKKDLKLFKDLGYKTFKNKVYINKEGAERVTISHVKLKGKKELIIHKRGKHVNITDFVTQRGDIFQTAENLGKLNLQNGEFITAQIEGRTQFRKRFKSMASLQHYIENVFSPQQSLNKKFKRNKKDQEKLRQELIAKMSIVRFKI